MVIFKVWTRDRNKKLFVSIKEPDNILEQLILQASRKLNVNGSKIVLERDGTEIDEDEVLDVFCKEILILLESEETWQPDNFVSDLDLDSSFATTKSLSSATTLTYVSGMSEDIPTTSTAATPPILFVVPPDSKNYNLQDNSMPPDEPNERRKPASEFTWSHFNIPWEKIPNYMLEACTNSRADKAIITEMVHIIVNEMRDINVNIPYKAFRIVGRKLADRFPKTFLDYDEDGTVLGDGMYGIVSKLHIRNCYLNRPHKRQFKQESQPVPLKKIRSVANLRAGCCNWQPQPEIIEIDDIKTSLKQISEKDQNFYLYLDKTYANQRIFLNNIESPPGILNILEEWPIIVTNKNVIYWHFKKLTNIDFQQIREKVLTKSQKILKLGQKMGGISINTEKDIHQSAIEILAKYFKEDIAALIIEDINSIDNIDSLNIIQPTILELGGELNKQYFVAMEGYILLNKQSCENFLEAMCITLCLYFNLNLLYPKNISATLEMIQRYYLKHHPDYGTKSNKKSSSKKKVIALINKLAKIKL